MKLIKPVFYFLVSSSLFGAAFGYIRACVYTNWSQFSRSTIGRFTPAKIPAELCTHIVFAYAHIRGTNITTTEFNDYRMYARLNRLRRDNPSLSILLAIGGWAAGGERFSRMASNDSAIRQFADNLVAYMNRYSFDGAVIDWEYPELEPEPGTNGTSDRVRYTRLLEILSNRFSRESNNNRTNRFVLSSALEVNATEARTLYEMDKIGRYLDFALINAYDIHGDWDTDPGALHHAALYTDISNFIGGWARSGFPASKIVLGMTAFGRSFTLQTQPVGTGLGQPVAGGGTPGVISRTRGLLDFGEICLNLRRRGWQRVWLEEQGVPIAFGNTTAGWQWVGFDDPRSVALKAEFVRQNGMAGMMLWSLDHEDHSNMCGTGPWPLLRRLARELPTDSSSLPETTRQPSSIKKKTAIPETTTERRTARDQTSPTPRIVNPTTTTTQASTSTISTTVPASPELPKDDSGQQLASSSSDNDEYEYETKEEKTMLSTIPNAEEWNGNTLMKHKSGSADYKQCQLSDTIGPAMRCPPNRSKPGDRYSFYIFCADGFFGILCRCLPGHFYNRCISMCDLEQNFPKCPMIY